MIEVRKTLPDEVPSFVEMEAAEDTAGFIIPYDLEKHQAEFREPNIVYLSILNGNKCIGFIILALDEDGTSVEFRRIVVSAKGNGFGQSAIIEMENFCKNQLKRNRVWLDVFEFNERGRYIYEKLDYVQFDQEDYHGKPLLYYEKML